jgi:hypothetical protein
LTTAIVVVPVPKEFHGLANLLNVDGSLFTIMKAGYILRMTPPGVFSLEEVNNMRFSARERTARWRNLDEIASRLNIPTISILGIKDSHDFCVPIWYHRGSIIITLHELHGIAVRLLGFQLKDSAAWLCWWEAPRRGMLFSQAATTRTALELADGRIEAAIIPASTPVQAGSIVSAVAMTDAGPTFTDTAGVSSLLHDDGSSTVPGTATPLPGSL